MKRKHSLLLCAIGIHKYERISGWWKKCIKCGKQKQNYSDYSDY